MREIPFANPSSVFFLASATFLAMSDTKAWSIYRSNSGHDLEWVVIYWTYTTINKGRTILHEYIARINCNLNLGPVIEVCSNILQNGRGICADVLDTCNELNSQSLERYLVGMLESLTLPNLFCFTTVWFLNLIVSIMKRRNACAVLNHHGVSQYKLTSWATAATWWASAGDIASLVLSNLVLMAVLD